MNSIRNQSQQTSLQHPQRLSLLATLAIAGQVIFLASAWLLPLLSEYSLIGDSISELAIGRYGLIQTLAFLISGLGVLGLAYAVRRLTAELRGSLVGSLLVAMYGAGAILSAIFPTDRIDSPADIASLSTTGTIHSVVALISFLGVIVGMFVLTRTFFKRESGWWSLSHWWLMLFPAGALALLFVQSEDPLVGILQRLLVSVISAWLVLVAFKIRSLTAPEKSIDERRLPA